MLDWRECQWGVYNPWMMLVLLQSSTMSALLDEIIQLAEDGK
jgi:hypothetical protein